jgi:outer membrane immunogenic protein
MKSHLLSACAAAVLCVVSAEKSEAQTNELLLRLEAKLDALTKENAALRARVNKIETARQAPAARVRVAALGNTASDAPPLTAAQRAANAAYVPAKAAPMVRSGCAQFGGGYVGAHGGAVLHDWNWSDRNAWAKNEVDLALPDSTSANRFGYEIGGHVGYDWQRGCALWGLVTDASWSGVKSSRYHTDGQPGLALDRLNVEGKLDWYGTARARAGIVIDNLLIYATGGVAYASTQWRASLTNFLGTVAVTETHADKELKWGAAVGAGTEWAWTNNWSMKGEFLYMRFADSSSTFNSAFATLNGNPAAKTFTMSDQMVVARAGLSYRWGQR